MKIEHITVTLDQFRELIIEGFGEYSGELPQAVYIILDEEKQVGFCSVCRNGRGSLDLQYIACMKGVDPSKKYRIYSETVQALHDLGFPFITGAVSNKNKGALMWAIRAGFVIKGVRQAITGELFVEVLHYKNVS
jgi:hypothetical protein